MLSNEKSKCDQPAWWLWFFNRKRKNRKRRLQTCCSAYKRRSVLRFLQIIIYAIQTNNYIPNNLIFSKCKKQKAYIAFCFLLTYDAQIIRNVLHGHITDASIMLLFAIFLLQSSKKQFIKIIFPLQHGRIFSSAIGTPFHLCIKCFSS